MNLKKKTLLIAAAFLCICLSGMAFVTKVNAADFRLLTNVAVEEREGCFVKDAETGKWRYLYEDGTYPVKTWKKIKSNIFYFDKNGYMKTGWRKYQKSWYYLQKSGKRKGMLVVGWKNIGGKRYYLSKETGARVTGWQTIGKYKYYFDSKGVLQKGMLMEGYWLDEKTGRATEYPPMNTSGAQTESTGSTDTDTGTASSGDDRSVHIFIGDSRTVGMCSAVTGIYSDGKLVKRVNGTEQEFYFGKISSGCSWYSTKAVSRLKKLLKKYPDAAVVLNHGINDLGSLGYYIMSYRSLMNSYPDAKFVIMSVNPVKTKKYKGYAKPALIQAFNKSMQAAFPNNFVDTYSFMKQNKFKTPDGLHYDTATYRTLYGYLLSYL